MDSNWRTLGLLFLMFCPFISSAQQQKVADTYVRNSVTTLFTVYENSSTASNIEKSAPNIVYTDKYFNNTLSKWVLPLPGYLQSDTSTLKRKEQICLFMENNKIGNAIVAKSFNRNEQGMFNLKLLNDRAQYNATDQDILISQASKRGEAMIKDFGVQLVDNSYVLNIDLSNLEKFDKDGVFGYSATMGFYLYKLNFDDQKINEFYKHWTYNDDDATTLAQKKAAFESMDIPVKPFYVKAGISMVSSDMHNNPLGVKTFDQLLTGLMQMAYDRAIFQIGKDLENFRVKAKVEAVHPIRAKIGKKEGVNTDNRYFIYEYVYNNKTDAVEPDRKAVVRVDKKVIDNRSKATGSTQEMTEFYQIYGGTIKEGMLMQQKSDFGLSILSGMEVGGMGGFNISAMYRSGGIVGVPALFLVGELAFDAKQYEMWGDENIGFTRWNVGLAKGWQMARIFEWMALVGYGEEYAAVDLVDASLNIDETINIKTGVFKVGAQLGIQITHNVQLFGKANFYMPGGASYTEDNGLGDKGESFMDYKWTDVFENRSGAAFGVGLRADF